MTFTPRAHSVVDITRLQDRDAYRVIAEDGLWADVSKFDIAVERRISPQLGPDEEVVRFLVEHGHVPLRPRYDDE